MAEPARTLWRDEGIRVPVVIFVVVRVVLALWVWLVRQFYPYPLPPDPALRPYVGVAVETRPWLEPWQRWDTLHYQAIAERGYAAFNSALFAPPLYPLLMRGLGSLLGGDTLLAGLVISNLACLGALIAFHGLAVQETGEPTSASRSVLYLVSFPAAFFLFAAYTESLFLLGAILALVSARQGRWWQAGLAGAVAALARLPGFLVAVPLAVAAWTARGRPAGRAAWIAPAITLAGGAVLPLYAWLGLRQVPWEPLLVQAGRSGGGIGFPGWNILEAAGDLISGKFFLVDVLDLAALILFLALAVPVCRRLSLTAGAYYVTFIALYLVRLGGAEPLLSMTRYVVALFPAFVILGHYGRRPWVNRVVLYVSWIGLLFMSGEFAIWGWVG